MTFAACDDVWIDFTATQRNLSDCPLPSNHSRSRAAAALPPMQGHEYLLIDLGPFSHVTRPGYVFHWIKSAMGFFIPGVLLTFFNIRLIQALRRSERLRRASCASSLSATHFNSMMASANHFNSTVASATHFNSMMVSATQFNSMVADTPKTARATVSRNRLNANALTHGHGPRLEDSGMVPDLRNFKPGYDLMSGARSVA